MVYWTWSWVLNSKFINYCKTESLELRMRGFAEGIKPIKSEF